MPIGQENSTSLDVFADYLAVGSIEPLKPLPNWFSSAV